MTEQSRKEPASGYGSLFLVSAPSGAGKSSLVNALLAQMPDIALSISTTTRAPRPGEVNGREYHFSTVEDFLAARDRNEFLEWAEVHGNYYGTSRKWIEDRMLAGGDVLLEIDWHGCSSSAQALPGSGQHLYSPALHSGAGRPPPQERSGFRDYHHKTPFGSGAEMAHASEFIISYKLIEFLKMH